MKPTFAINSAHVLKLLALLSCALWCQSVVIADVVVLQDGRVLTGTILKKDSDGVLLKRQSGTYRYPQSWLREIKNEPAAAPHVSNNGQRIPDWAQIITLVANAGWSDGLKQVPATMIETGAWKNVPYISFTCRYGGYDLNIFGDLEKPAGFQIGAMAYLKQSDEAKSNIVNLACSILANADDRKMVQALNLNQKDAEKNGDMVFETIMPGEWGSYGGWWVSVYSQSALANARASDDEMFTLTQPPVTVVAAPQAGTATTQQAATTPAPSANGAAAPQSPPPAAQSSAATTYGVVPAWSAEELAYARRVTPDAAAAAASKVYPRSYTRTGGTYAHPETRR